MHFDVFNNDAFSLSHLSRAMVDLPHQPGRIGELGWFAEEGISTLSLSIESMGSSLSLVSTSERGAPATAIANEKRKLRTFAPVHLARSGAITADEIQNLRAFGSETEVELATTLLNRKLARAKRDIDVTHEWGRIGAIKGQWLDADGTSVLLDMYDAFGVTQQSLSMALTTDTTKVKQKTMDVIRKIEDALGGLRFTGVRVLCSEGFFDALIEHPAVKKAYDLWQDGQFFRDQQRNIGGGGGFAFAGVFWEPYRGKVGNTAFIADGEAYAVPEGVSDLFVTYFAPADDFDTVNTMGLPYYARQFMSEDRKRLKFEVQSNPLHLVTRPKAIIKLTA